MAQQMDVEPMQQMVAGGQGSSGDARATRRQLGAQMSSSASSEYGPITMSRTYLVERQVVQERRDDTPTKLLLQHAASQAQSVAMQQSRWADQAENLAQNLHQQGEARIAAIISGA